MNSGNNYARCTIISTLSSIGPNRNAQRTMQCFLKLLPTMELPVMFFPIMNPSGIQRTAIPSPGAPSSLANNLLRIMPVTPSPYAMNRAGELLTRHRLNNAGANTDIPSMNANVASFMFCSVCIHQRRLSMR